MGGEQYVYTEGDASWLDTFGARMEQTAHGMNGIILTEYTTSVVCAIAAGSVVEINGAVFQFSAETAITGTPASGVNYIICSVTGTTASPYWDQTIFSTYDTAKAGLYTGASRYVAECHYGATGVDYLGKYVYPERTRDLIRKLPIGNWDMPATGTAAIIHGLGTVTTFIRQVNVHIYGDSDAFAYNFNYLATSATSAITQYVQINDNQVRIIRPDSPPFTLSSFDTSTGYNRGWAYLWYEI